MSYIQPVMIKQHTATLLPTLSATSVSPSRHSEEEYVQLNQGPYGILELADERTGPSRVDNPTFDPSTIVDSCNNLALQQKQQQRQNQQLVNLVAKLSEKIDDLKATKSAVSDDEGKDNNSKAA